VNDIENQERWPAKMALILIIIVLISNLLANALRKYYGKKANELTPFATSKKCFTREMG
jgi:hypothetical protein